MENIAQGMRSIAAEERANSERVREQNRQNQAALLQVKINTQVNERLNRLMTQYDNPDDYRYWAQSTVQDALDGGQKEIQKLRDPVTRGLAQNALISQAGQWIANMENAYRVKVQTKTLSDASQTLQDMVNAVDTNNAEDYYYRGMAVYESLAAAGYINPNALIEQSQKYGEQLHTLALTREINRNPDTLIALGTEAAQETYFRTDPLVIRQLYDRAIDRKYTLQQRARELWEQHTKDTIGRLMIDLNSGAITEDEYRSRLTNMAQNGQGDPYMIASALGGSSRGRATGEELVNRTIDIAAAAYGQGVDPENIILALPVGPDQRMDMLDIWNNVNNKMPGPQSVRRNIDLGLSKYVSQGTPIDKLHATAISFLRNRGVEPTSDILIPIRNRLGEQYGRMLGVAALRNVGTSTAPGQAEVNTNDIMASITGISMPVDKKTGAPLMEQFVSDWVNNVINDYMPAEEATPKPTKAQSSSKVTSQGGEGWSGFWHKVYEEDRQRARDSSVTIQEGIRDLRRMRNETLQPLYDALGLSNLSDAMSQGVEDWSEFWHREYEEDRRRARESSATIQRGLGQLREIRNETVGLGEETE